jgi:alkanesulfonate monooxygenase SsuD/methylene tetrahydromethanopterin reductase-like flavin-dependent oxidoreductase (luciferase family)
VGRGAFPLYYVGFDVPQEESRERFAEALDFILAAWNSEHFSLTANISMRTTYA